MKLKSKNPKHKLTKIPTSESKKKNNPYLNLQKNPIYYYIIQIQLQSRYQKSNPSLYKLRNNFNAT